MTQAAFRALVSGRVQMVMYRDFTRRKAKKLGLVGEVTNLPDGRVSITAEGSKDTLDTLIALLKKGSIFSRVDNVAVEWVAPSNTFEHFSIRY